MNEQRDEIIQQMRQEYRATFTVLEQHNKLMPSGKLHDSMDMLLAMAYEKGRQAGIAAF